jgi:hypothetical protein
MKSEQSRNRYKDPILRKHQDVDGEKQKDLVWLNFKLGKCKGLGDM